MYVDDRGKVEGNSKCPACNQTALVNWDRRIDAALVICQQCGKFVCSGIAAAYLDSEVYTKSPYRYRAYHRLRTTSERAHGKKDNSYFPTYSTEDFLRWLVAPDPTVQEKLTLMLQWIAQNTPFPGKTVDLDVANDFPVICAVRSEEMRFYVTELVDRGFVRLEQSYVGRVDEPRVTVLAKGWEQLQLVSASPTQSSTAFVAMWFDSSRTEYDNAIANAIGLCGYQPVRIDRVEHVNRIDDEIISRLRASRFLVADFTGQRAGVYFEAGFMLGLGKPVIWVCAKDEIHNLHFDTRQYNTIDYENASDLQKRLEFRIQAIVGKL